MIINAIVAYYVTKNLHEEHKPPQFQEQQEDENTLNAFLKLYCISCVEKLRNMGGAENFDDEPAPEQNVAENTDTDSADFILVPEKRKKRARCVSIILCTITAILVIIFIHLFTKYREFHQ
jgi:hypothetical protein